MRAFEVILLITLLLSLLALLIRPIFRLRSNWAPAAISLVAVVFHLVLEGARWQLYPAYAILGLLSSWWIWFLISGRNQYSGQGDKSNRLLRIVRIVAISFAMILTISCMMLAHLIPVFAFPEPTGEYSVGSTYLHLIDESREELFTNDSTDYRAVFAQVWYPTNSIKEANPSYWGNISESSRMLSGMFGLPPFVFSHLSLVEANHIIDAPISGKLQKYPVIIFQHGYTFWIQQNTPLMEHLASNGYIVVSVGHAFETAYFLDEHGHTLPFDWDHWKVQLNWKEYLDPDINSIYRRRSKISDIDSATQLEYEYLQTQPATQQSTRMWAQDASFVIDELEGLQASHKILANKMELGKLGALGMSFGASATGQLCVIDNRIKAGISLDGTQSGDVIQTDLALPYMFIENATNTGGNRLYFHRAKNEAYYLQVANTNHLNFSDFGYFSPLFRDIGLIGSIDQNRMNQVLNSYVLSFFNKHLFDRESVLLRGPSSDFPEVTIEAKQGNNTDQ